MHQMGFSLHMCEQNQEYNRQIIEIVTKSPTSYYKLLVKNPKNRHLYDYIMSWTSFIKEDVKLALRIYLTLNAMTEREKCANPACSNFIPDSKYLPIIGKTKTHCCPKCAGADPMTLKRREQKCIEKYGVSSISKVKAIKDRCA